MEKLNERFLTLVRISGPDRRPTLRDYQNALGYFVKPNLELIFDAITAEAERTLGGSALARMSNLLCSFHSSLTLWEQIDREV